MTALMRRLHASLPAEEQYPLPPQEITQRIFPGREEDTLRDLSLLTHAGFGAAAGAVLSSIGAKGPLLGSTGGLLVWLASYFGWIPSSDILRSADKHPLRRNLLMVLVHLVWGSVTALSSKKLLAARLSMLANGLIKEAPASRNR